MDDEMAEAVKGIREDITLLKASTGEAMETYQKTVMDKLWRLARAVGEHYLSCLATITELEKEATGEATIEPALAEMKEIVEACQPSDTPSVDSESVPLPPSPPSSE